MRRRAALVAIVLCACVTAPARAVTTPAGRLDRALARLVAMPHGPAGAIAMVQRGSARSVHRAGVGDRRGRTPVRSTDRMRMASASKAFSGAVALALVDQGALSLDDTVGQRLPALPAAWGPVTLRQLLQHTSGLPDFTQDKAYLGTLQRDPHMVFLPHASLLSDVSDEPLLFAPGAQFHYSNSDNIVVALMAEQATAQPYTALLASLVFSPLGLNETSLPDGYRLPSPYLHGYDNMGSPPEDLSTALTASSVWASGGIVSSPIDANAFARGYVGGKLFGVGTEDQQLQLVPGHSEPTGPGANAAGLGIFRYRTRCGTVYGHTGNFPGYTQFLAATRDGVRSVTVTVSEQLNETMARPQLTVFRALRRAEETAVCAALG
jgi:D-alanyl-D-alanine carboxypeptidase